MLLCAGGVLVELRPRAAHLVHRPALSGRGVYPATVPIAKMTANEIFRGYVRFMGVGAIATAGIFGIVKSLKIVVGSFSIAAKAFRARRAPRRGADRPRHLDHEDPDRRRRLGSVAVAIFLGSLGTTAVDRPRRPRPDARLLVLLHVGRGQRDRDDRPQPGLRHDDADDHHLVGRAARVRRLGADRHVLRHGDRRHGLHGAVGVGPDDHGPEDRLLAGLDARRAGAGQVLRRHLLVGRRWASRS